LAGSILGTCAAPRQSGAVTITRRVTLKGSTYTPLIMTIGGKTYKNFYAFGINNYGTITGFYYDSSGVGHAFKCYSRNGNCGELSRSG
jgi:hypothetical protein